mmetsp:Transcript_88580/g.247778  ORF Transcript_88580/g.247778 Transcript_88580/m.247778 type:complete len:203 (-) Transcript_88580:102-710(-)
MGCGATARAVALSSTVRSWRHGSHDESVGSAAGPYGDILPPGAASGDASSSAPPPAPSASPPHVPQHVDADSAEQQEHPPPPQPQQPGEAPPHATPPPRTASGELLQEVVLVTTGMVASHSEAAASSIAGAAEDSELTGLLCGGVERQQSATSVASEGVPSRAMPSEVYLSLALLMSCYTEALVQPRRPSVQSRGSSAGGGG